VTPELWAVLIPAIVGVLSALAAWLHSLENRSRITALERHRGEGPQEQERVAPRKE
jgi:hypothetical protein